MKIFTIGDLHLSHQVEKPMDIFGEHWQNHVERISDNWKKTINEKDLVIIPGDLSWATYLEQAEEDFKFLDNLPGRKILVKGNHDYWWETLTKMKKFLNEIGVANIDFLHNNSHTAGKICFCGTKGWDSKEEKDLKIINRELSRFRTSIDSIEGEPSEVIAVFHYPPDENPDLIDLMKKNGIKKCIYGHIHGKNRADIRYIKDGIEYINASADQIGFSPIRI